MTAYLMWGFTHLGALALMELCAIGLSNLFLRKCRFHSLVERLVFSIALGFGLCALFLFLLGVCGLLYRGVIWVLTIAGTIATCWTIWRANREKFGLAYLKQTLSWKNSKGFFTLRRIAIGFFVLCFLAFWMLTLMKSWYPPHNWDSISNHLVIARANLRAHRPTLVFGVPYPVLPLLNHMLFTWGMALKDDILSQMVVNTFLLLIALGLYTYGKRNQHPGMGWAAAAIWLSHPLIIELGSTAYVDIGLTCFVFLGIYALRIFWKTRESSWWCLGLALLAMAAGSKITGIFFLGIGSLLGLVALAPFLLTKRRRQEGLRSSTDAVEIGRARFTWKSLLLGWILATLIVVPWYALDGYQTGNPLWPFFSQYNSGIWKDVNMEQYMTGFRNASLKKFLMVYIDFNRDPVRFNAENNLKLFPVIVAWPLAWVIALFNRDIRWWVLWAMSFTIFWFLEFPLIRYWLPVLPIAGLVLCQSLQWILKKVRVPTSISGGFWLVAATVLIVWSGSSVEKIIMASPPPTTAAGREAYLSQLNAYPGVTYLNARAQPNDAVAVLSASWLNYYFNVRVIDLRSALYGNRKPTFHWPEDQLWSQWLDYEHINWIFIFYVAPELNIPKQNPLTNPFWPDFQLVYANNGTWIFRRKPVPPEIGYRMDHAPRMLTADRNRADRTLIPGFDRLRLASRDLISSQGYR